MPGPRPCLTLEALRRFVRQECFASGDGGLVGVELESLTYPSTDPLRRPSATDLLTAVDGAELPHGGRVTLEPGGQVELSSRPQPGLSLALSATAVDHAGLCSALRQAGIEPVARGLDLLRPPRRILDHPRYTAMEAYFDAQGLAGRTMMCATAAIQVNLDAGPPAEVASRWRLAHAIGPVLGALFANSPGAHGAGLTSARQRIWAVIDPSRTAPVHRPGRTPGADPAEEWLAYALAARVMLIRCDQQRFHPVREPLSFATWMARGHELGYPALDDFAYHLTTLFPPVRPRGWLELRMIDALPEPWWQVAVAVTTAILDDGEAAAAAGQATWGSAGLWSEAARFGLAHPALASAARQVFSAALGALPRLGADAATLATAGAFYERFVLRGRCPGDEPSAPPPVRRSPLRRSTPAMATNPTLTVDVHLGLDDLRDSLRHDAARGLVAAPKELPPKWFYDDRGSELFDRITRLPEYYPTRRERAILVSRSAEIAARTGADTLVELGSGTSEKTRFLLDAMTTSGRLRRFVPFDVSEATLRAAADGVARDYPGVEVHAVVGDFEAHLDRLPGGGRRLVAFLGGTIGNLVPGQRAAFLAELAAGLEPGDALLLGTDLVKEPARLQAAYDDAGGVTAEFNRNVLRVLNREVGADFDPECFVHVARWNAEQEWIEMWLRSTEDQTVTVADLGLSVGFAAGEEMRTEVSAKFRRPGVEAELAAAGLDLAEWWTDPDGDYAVSLAFAG